MTTPRLNAHAFVLAVHDLPSSTAYFIDVLGFAKDWNDGDNWQAVIRDGVRIMMGRCSNALPPALLGDHNYFAFLATDDVDTLHAEFAARGAKILAPPADKPWGWREMSIATPEGHRMMFAQSITGR
jgi:predicted enzyme related to lactoylglutathione lyase